MKKFKKLLLFVFATGFFICLIISLYLFKRIHIAYADNQDSTLTEDSDINYDCTSILAVLNEEATYSLKTYTAADFSKFGCNSVIELTAETFEIVKQQLSDSENESTINSAITLEKYRRILKLQFSSNVTDNLEAIVKELEKRNDISCANLNYVYENIADEESSDIMPYIDISQWAIDYLNLPQAWGITTGSKDINVGIIDTGIDGNHPYLADNLDNNFHRDFRNATTTVINSAFDTGDHGTHVAGIIGLPSNSPYAKGVCDDVNLIALIVNEIIEGKNKWFSDSVILAVEYATAHNIKVLNFSGKVFIRGIEDSNINDSALQQAISQYPGLFVTAAGNNNSNVDLYYQYPARYSRTLDNVITVGALDYTGNIASYSNYGLQTVDIYAPGSRILSSYPVAICESGECPLIYHIDNGYHYKDGTSMATPFVSGVATLMLSENPNLTGRELKTLIMAGADDISINITTSTGGTITQQVKKLNAYKAVRYVDTSDSFNLVFLETTNCPEGFKSNTKFLWLRNGDPWPNTVEVPTAPFGYEFPGYFYTIGYAPNDSFKIYYASGGFCNINYYFKKEKFDAYKDLVLQAAWQPKIYLFAIGMSHPADPDHHNYSTPALNYEQSYSKAMAPENTVNGVTKGFSRWDITIGTMTEQFSTDTTLSFRVKDVVDKYGSNPAISKGIYIHAIYDVDVGGSCIAPGSLITLADGSQKAVEELTGNEMLLVWDMQTGSFTSTPILFIDYYTPKNCKIINLSFSDGTTVEVIYEHAFWDFNLNEYVFMREDSSQYIGHWFNKQTTDGNGNMIWSSVQLTDVEITNEYSAAYSPVTYSYLCYYVNGMLSMPGATEGLINIFEVDSETMTYNQQAFANDIETYGLFTYEEFYELIPVPEEVFNAFNGQYMKVAFGKGLLTENDLAELYGRYSDFFN